MNPNECRNDRGKNLLCSNHLCLSVHNILQASPVLLGITLQCYLFPYGKALSTICRGAAGNIIIWKCFPEKNALLTKALHV